MALMKCKSCSGEYQTEQPLGIRYFHVCPPLHRVVVDRLGVEMTVDAADVELTDTVKRDVYVPRPGHRDENVKIVEYDKSGNAVTAPKSEGAGAEPAPVK